MTDGADDDARPDVVDIRILDDPAELRRVMTVFNQVWGSRTPLVGVELLRAIVFAGGYVAGAYVGDQVVGGSLGFLARHEGEQALHSHITGVLPGVRKTGLGRAMKLHQRSWAAAHDLSWVTWTFDPLVRRNAWFNIGVLGAEVHAYLIDFYGPIEDAINVGGESDRLLVAWSTAPDGTTDAATPGVAAAAGLTGTIAVPTPEDIVVLRRTDPTLAGNWRHRLRRELGTRLQAGATVVAFTRDGDYLVRP